MNIYCGNNANHPELLNGTKILGTRYSCLQKGKLNGYSQPVDPNFLLPYQPIDTTKKYCGNSVNLPVGYDRFGGLYECYLKGMGVGKKLKAQNNQPVYNSQNSDMKYNEDSEYLSMSSLSAPVNTPVSLSMSSVPVNTPVSLSMSSVPVNTPVSLPMSSLSAPVNTPVSLPMSSLSAPPKNTLTYYIIGLVTFILGFAGFFIGLYYGKPGFIMDKTKLNEKIIDWSIFIPYLISFAVIYGLLVYFFIIYLLNK